MLPFPSAFRAEPGDLQLSAEQRRRLIALRHLARASSLACRPQCAIGRIVSKAAADRCEQPCAAEVFRAFIEIADRRIALYRPDAEAVSDDEHWLLRLMAALSNGQLSAAAGLIAFRVEKARRREALAAAGAVAARLASIVCSCPEHNLGEIAALR